MKRLCALVLGVALALAGALVAPGPAAARPAANQQAIDYVIARALAQRGVPYTYGGGDISGPTLGAEPEITSAVEPDPLVSIFGTTPAVQEPRPRVAGFDASGLIVYAFGGVGIKLPRSSGEQYKVGRKIPPSLALPGDLIFYGPEGTQSVALFLGNGQMLEATTPAVAVSPVRTNNMAPYLSRIIE
ncbi:hydrolase [Mycolicibacterium chitae]|uniref:Cell wall-associated hydrolase, invasion-associated protein n=1 Tax=Mycolicibacterium chitae TaxID=1792 RepID=A0A448I677_MYCCI|nr:NlpC/P60 family peptidoglycan-binding protein RipD [Mycolicibacterium chitae]MCV7108015.1 NlpC/P60 family peptidoglycan-binding protein RipD [Mycolicibacterium chitae]BBZ04411.1 hydrolase [Mycolicibacterium chitae]VEG48047.1 cell wall-associated hydrolase, invasion-associated protein [Mycolicibacterium chitae]